MDIKIMDLQNREIAIETLESQYPDLVAYDINGWDIDWDRLDKIDPDSRGRIGLIWPSEESSVNDDGSRAIAEIKIR